MFDSDTSGYVALHQTAPPEMQLQPTCCWLTLPSAPPVLHFSHSVQWGHLSGPHTCPPVMYGALHSSISVITMKKNGRHQLAGDEPAETESASPEQCRAQLVSEYHICWFKIPLASKGCGRLWNKVNLFLAVSSYLCFYESTIIDACRK